MTLDADRAGTIGCVDALLVLAWQGCASFARHAHTHSGLLHAAALDQRALSWHARKGRIYKNTKPALVNLNMIMQGDEDHETCDRSHQKQKIISTRQEEEDGSQETAASPSERREWRWQRRSPGRQRTRPSSPPPWPSGRELRSSGSCHRLRPSRSSPLLWWHASWDSDGDGRRIEDRARPE